MVKKIVIRQDEQENYMSNHRKLAPRMTRRQLLNWSVKGSLALACSSLGKTVLAQEAKIGDKKNTECKAPNILWICTDQQRSDTIACLGNSLIHTPNLDKLVADGVTFTNAFAQSTVCTPSRAAFMTGRYPHLTGSRDNGYDIRDNEVLISKMFADQGYHCGLIGKLHLSATKTHAEHRIDDGYAEFIYSHDPSSRFANQYQQWLESKGYKWNDIYKRPKGKYAFAGVPVELHQTTWCFERAMEFITTNKQKPWFLNVNVFAPHHPFDPSEEYFKKYDPNKMPDPLYRPGELKNKPPNQTVDHNGAYGGLLLGFSKMSPYERKTVTAAYYAMIEQADHQIGRLLQKLDETGQRNNTIVVFTSDHGEMLGNHGLYLKGHFPYDDLIHVPLILSWPGHFSSALRSSALVELIDIAPTLLEAAGQPASPRMQGRSLFKICAGKADPGVHRDLVYAERYGGASTDHKPTYFTMIRDRKYKLTVYHDGEHGELYDLQEDPHEFKNLWNDPKFSDVKLKLVKKCFDTQVLNLDPVPKKSSDY